MPGERKSTGRLFHSWVSQSVSQFMAISL